MITAGARGTGDDEVRVKVRPNLSGSGRTASIQLVEDDNAFCKVEQEAARSGSSTGMVSALVWASELQVEGGAGRISVDGAQAALVGPGRSQGTHPCRAGSHRVEALLSAGRGEPGIWRFGFGGAFRPGSLRLRAGDVASVSSEAIVFRLRGAPASASSFDLEAGR